MGTGFLALPHACFLIDYISFGRLIKGLTPLKISLILRALKNLVSEPVRLRARCSSGGLLGAQQAGLPGKFPLLSLLCPHTHARTSSLAIWPHLKIIIIHKQFNRGLLDTVP